VPREVFLADLAVKLVGQGAKSEQLFISRSSNEAHQRGVAIDLEYYALGGTRLARSQILGEIVGQCLV